MGGTATNNRIVRRLRATPEQGSVQVDRTGNGVIRGLSICSPGSAKGHGFALDKLTSQQVVSYGDGMKGRWTHPDLCSDGLGHYLGRWSNLRMVGDRAVGDFAFGRAAHQFHPEGLKVSAAEYLLSRAEEVSRGEERPDVLGVSIVAAFDLEPREGDEPLARISSREALTAADFVDTPAANDGLFGEGPSALAARGADHLDFLAAELGQERVHAFLHSWLNRNSPNADGGTVTLEEAMKKIAGLEIESAKKDAALAAGQTQLTAVQAQLGAMVAADEARKAVEAKARQAANETFVSELASKSAALQAPIEAQKLELVRRAFARGDEDGARALGAAFLGEAEAKAKLTVLPGGKQAPGGPANPLGPQPSDGDKAVAETVVSRLRAMGIKSARLSEDGRSWTTDPTTSDKE